MKKLICLFTSILLFGCSSPDDSRDDSSDNSNTNYVEFKGDKYYLDDATVTREHSGNTTTFNIVFRSKLNTHLLSLGVSTSAINTVPCPTCPKENILPATYKLKTTAYLKGVGLFKLKSNTSVTLISSEDLTGIQNPSRVTITKNSDTNYSFSFGLVSPVGDLTGEYVGEIKKTNY